MKLVFQLNSNWMWKYDEMKSLALDLTKSRLEK